MSGSVPSLLHTPSRRKEVQIFSYIFGVCTSKYCRHVRRLIRLIHRFQREHVNMPTTLYLRGTPHPHPQYPGGWVRPRVFLDTVEKIRYLAILWIESRFPGLIACILKITLNCIGFCLAHDETTFRIKESIKTPNCSNTNATNGVILYGIFIRLTRGSIWCGGMCNKTIKCNCLLRASTEFIGHITQTESVWLAAVVS